MTTTTPGPGWSVRVLGTGRRVAVDERIGSAGAKAEGDAVRHAYANALREVVRTPLAPPRTLEAEVFALSGERDLPEQVASVRSFLTHAGEPRAFTVVSDGSHGAAARALLRRVHPCVRVADLAEVAPEGLPERAAGALGDHVFAAKLALELALPRALPALYADADVLFHAGAHLLAGLLAGPARFLRDEEPYLDRRLLGDVDAERTPVNAGFLVLPRPLAWDGALARLGALLGPPAFHTEQTVVHLALHASGARPLDPARFVVSTAEGAPAGRDVALRHYTTPVRHELWRAVARSR